MNRPDAVGEGLLVFETVLIADRGLLAARIIRSCQRLGIKAVTCVADGDENALHARLADEAIRVGGAPEPGSPDLDLEAVVEAAHVSGAQAIHPGGAGRARDDAFARAVLAAGLAWVGAPPGWPAGSHREHPAWRTTSRGGRTVLWETSTPAPDWDNETLIGPDRLVEAVTGVDLVERQLRQAAGERLDDLPAPSGHGIQAALYAASNTLVPVAVSGWVEPDAEGVVTDSVLADGAWLTRYDGAVLALVTTRGRDRPEALARLTSAVDGMAVDQPPAALAALRALLREPSVISVVG